MSKNRSQTWLALIVMAVGTLLAGIVGLFGYMSLTATPLHPDPDGVPTASAPAAPSTWNDQAAQASLIAREALVGSSGLVSTPSDLVRFGLAIDSGRLLQPATVKLLQASQRLGSGQETEYGLGWDLETVSIAGEQKRLVVHDGMLRDGMVASFIAFPERGLVVAVTSNTSFADTASIALKIADIFARTAKEPATPAK